MTELVCVSNIFLALCCVLIRTGNVHCRPHDHPQSLRLSCWHGNPLFDPKIPNWGYKMGGTFRRLVASAFHPTSSLSHPSPITGSLEHISQKNFRRPTKRSATNLQNVCKKRGSGREISYCDHIISLKLVIPFRSEKVNCFWSGVIIKESRICQLPCWRFSACYCCCWYNRFHIRHVLQQFHNKRVVERSSITRIIQ